MKKFARYPSAPLGFLFLALLATGLLGCGSTPQETSSESKDMVIQENQAAGEKSVALEQTVNDF